MENIKQNIKELLKVKAAARELVSKMDLIQADPRYISIWTIAHVHGVVYDGPNWCEELENLRKAVG